MKCRSCNSPIEPFLNLGRMPLVNSFMRNSELKNEKKYPLAVGFCPHCYLVQLMVSVNPNILFRKYLYFSSTSSSFVNHCNETAQFLTKKLKLSKNSLVFEIASNDGMQLKAFQKLHIPVLGIDPAKNIASIANKQGIPTIAKFFNAILAKELHKKQNINADCIFGANVLAHVPKINDFLKGVKTILKQNGTAVFESPYIKGLFEKKFDTIYHEHVFYYSVLALKNVLERNKLEIYDIDFTDMQGGSFRIFASHPGMFPVTKRLIKILNEEKTEGYAKFSTYKKINNNILLLKKQLIQLLKSIKKSGKTIAAYGAPAKGVILLNYFQLEKYLDFIVDKSKQKQNFFVPGTKMKVNNPELIYKKNPDYVLILCWNIAKEVRNQLHPYAKSGGKFIIPIPKIKIP